MKQKLRSIDLNLFPIFDALVNEQNLSRAAVRLNMSQPAVSNALSRLRKQVDDDLFTRTAKGMIPTPRALSLHRYVQQALNLIDSGIEDDGAFEFSTSTVKYRIAMNDTGEAILAPPMLGWLRKNAPNLTIEIHQDNAQTLQQQLSLGNLDLAIDYITLNDKDITYEPLLEEQVAVIAHVDHPEIGEELSLEQYSKLAHVAVQPRGDRGSPLDIVLGSMKVHRNNQLYVPHFVALPNIVAHSDLVGTVSMRLAKHFETIYPIKILPFPLDIPPIQVSMIWHKNSNDLPSHAWLREQIRTWAANM